MDTTKHTATRTIDNKTIEVAIEVSTWTEAIVLDGMATDVSKTYTSSRTEIVIKDDAGRTVTGRDIKSMDAAKKSHASQYAQAVKMGYAGMVGNGWIKQDVIDAINDAMAEVEAAAPKTTIQIDIETDEQRAHREFARKMEASDSDY